MVEILKMIGEAIKNNSKNPLLPIIIIFFIFLAVICYPIIENNFIYYLNMNNKIELLEKVTSLDITTINENEITKKEYEIILDEMERHQIFYDNYTERTPVNEVFKFFCWSISPFFVMICVPFMNTFKNKKQKISAFFMMLILTVLFGLFGKIIPIIPLLWANYVFPIFVQICGLIFIALKLNKKK